MAQINSRKTYTIFINNIINNKTLPVYGNGNYIRDWLFVIDHSRAIDLIFHQGSVGDTYNIGGFNEWKISIWLRNFVFKWIKS